MNQANYIGGPGRSARRCSTIAGVSVLPVQGSPIPAVLTASVYTDQACAQRGWAGYPLPAILAAMLAALHPDLLSSLQQLPGDQPVVLFTRHSIREQPANGFAGYSVPLTPEGVALAEAWGSQLRRPVHVAVSSPVGRCVDTAKAMLAGAGLADTPVTAAPQLVEPGCFVRDIRMIGKTFVDLGPVGFANLHFREPLPGICSPGEGTAALLSFMREQLGPPGSLSLLVTHDTILAACINTLAGVAVIDDADWPWMMEGAFLWFSDTHVHWLWRGQTGARALDTL